MAQLSLGLTNKNDFFQGVVERTTDFYNNRLNRVQYDSVFIPDRIHDEWPIIGGDPHQRALERCLESEHTPPGVLESNISVERISTPEGESPRSGGNWYACFGPGGQ